MKSKVAERILANTPKDVGIFVSLYAKLVIRINQVLKEKGITQKSLAQSLDKSPSEIHKWLNGDHNFTLRSLAKLEAELGEPLLEVPARKPAVQYQGHVAKSVVVYTVYRNTQPQKETAWLHSIKTTPIKSIAHAG